MAVTAHWIETKILETAQGQQTLLTLRADLIGFLRVPGHHTGKHLAHAMMYILDRVEMGDKVSSIDWSG